MERSSRSTRSGAAVGGKKSPKKDVEKPKIKKEKATPTKNKKEEEDRPESPFFGFTNSDIPQPIVIKTEPVGDMNDEECVVVSVSKGTAPPVIKTEKIEDDDLELDTFHGFSLEDLPKPIVIKEEAKEDDVSANITESTSKDPLELVDPKSNIPGDNLLDEFESVEAQTASPEKKVGKTESPVKIKKVVSPAKAGVTISSQAAGATKIKSPKMILSSSGPQSPEKSQNIMIVQNGKPVVVQSKIDSKQQIQQIHLISEEDLQQTGQDKGPKKIQIIDQNGEKIELITQDATDGEFETDTEEDHEFTVIVENNDEGEVTGITRDIHIDENNVIAVDNADAMEIEDIIAQFEESSSGGARTVSCPNCKKCFVSSQFLNMHIANTATMCDLCNTQCCSQVNLRNHKNLECDLSKRKRNIDLIAKETALLGRKPIEPEKYYNLPIESDEDLEDEDFSAEDVASPQPAKKMKSINDAKYECNLCGKYVKILDSHMRFVHGMEAGARGDKFRCPECSVLVSDLETHIERRHGDNVDKIVVEDITGEVVRCRHPGCDLFFNNAEEVAEHIKREHTDEVKLACGMGGCDEIFDNRGALKRHRTEAHPELEEFKPVDLEPDDPDRQHDMTVACPVCERKFKHKNTCTVHIKTNHLGWSKRKLFECPDCFRSFDNKKAVETHREAVHLGIRTLCPLCEKPVTRLDLHVRMVHTELPEWPCPDCGKKFKRKFDLNRHRVTVHLGVRNFPCDLCGKRFADMKDMTRHKNAVHYGMKIKWNSRKYKEKTGKLKPKSNVKKEDSESNRKKAHELKLEESNVTYIETVETTGEEIIAMGGLEGSTVILDSGTVLQSHLEAVKGAPGEPQVFIEADPDGHGAYRFVVMTEEEAGSVLGTGDTVEVR